MLLTIRDDSKEDARHRGHLFSLQLPNNPVVREMKRGEGRARGESGRI